MKKITYILTTSVLFFSCSDVNNNISSLSYLPPESEVILNINNLSNTKEILSKNKNLDNI